MAWDPAFEPAFHPRAVAIVGVPAEPKLGVPSGAGFLNAELDSAVSGQ